jgi:predicted transcriptional regulator of viral defense system
MSKTSEKRRVVRTSPQSPASLRTYVDGLQMTGRYTFTRQEAHQALGISEIAFRNASRRLIAKGRIVAPRRGFFVIVPLEYASSGAPPPSWYVDALMKFHGRPYYVALLQAAALHGAAHQQPQEFQVVTNEALRPAMAGRARIRFFLKRLADRTPTVRMKTETGSMLVSTPEATALDLVRYMESAGHLGNVATVLAELAERIDGERLVHAAKADVELSVVQRLGYVLDQIADRRLTEPLAIWLGAQRPRITLLRPDRGGGDASRDNRWNIAINDKIEADE